MNFLQSFVLGVVQGLTEFLPISSTAHLKIVPGLLGWPDPGAAATAVIQLGTMLAVVVYFRRDLLQITLAFFRSLRPGADRSSLSVRLAWAVIVGTIPISLIGLALKGQIETSFRSTYVIAGALIGMGLLLGLAEILAKHRRGLEDITIRDGLLVGIAQAIALVPGASRSGSTLTGALLIGLNREAAARFSFLLSIPAVVLSGLLEMKDVIRPDPSAAAAADTMHWTLPDLILSTVVSGIVGYASIAFLLKYLRTHTTLVFIVYRLLLGAVILYLASAGLMK